MRFSDSSRYRSKPIFCALVFLVVHSLNAHNFDLEGELLRTTRRLMATSPSPDKGMLMRIPVGSGFLHRFLDLLPSLKAFAFERQRAQDLPPGFDQVQVGRIGGLIDKLPAGMMDHEQ